MSSTGSNSDGGVRNGNSLPWATRMTISFLSFVTDTSRRSNGTINRRFLHLCDFRSPPTPNPKSTAGSRSVSTSDVTVDSSRNLWFRLFVPASASAAPNSLPVLVFFHGGGFAFLSPDSFAYDAVCRRMARKIPAVVASVNYRLSPEHRYPCQYDDGFDVLNFLDGNHEVVLPRAADLSRCFLVGDSAGANLAHHVAVRAARKIRSSSSSSASPWKAVRIEGLISIQPYFGGEERTESEVRLPRGPVVTVERSDWLWKAFLPEGANRDHPVCNVSGPYAEDISGLEEFPNRTVVIVGGLDPLQDWQRRYYHWLRRSGKDARLLEYPAMIHAFYIFPELPDSTHLLTQLRGFIYPGPQSFPTLSV